MLKSQSRLPGSDPAAEDAAHTCGLMNVGEKTPLTSSALLDGRSSVSIDHGGTIYVLRATKTGKLILTK